MARGAESQAGRMLLVAFPRLISGVPSPRCIVTPLDAGQHSRAVKRCYSFLMSSLMCTSF